MTPPARILLASQNIMKLEEVRSIFPQVEVLDVELREIQSVDVRTVIEDKLAQVAELDLPHPVIVEDTGLALDALNGLPGALVKWSLERLGAQGLKDSVALPGAPDTATAVSAVGVVHRGERRVWVGEVAGRLVDGRGSMGGWTPILEIAGTGRTLGEMDFADRMHWTMRREPLERAREWLATRPA